MAKTTQYTARTGSAMTTGQSNFINIGLGDPSQSTGDNNDTRTSAEALGAYSHLYVRVTTNAMTSPGTMSCNRNATPGVGAVSITAGAANQAFEDNVGADIPATDDILNLQIVNGGGGNLQPTVRGVCFNALLNTSVTLGSFNRLVNGANAVAFGRLAGNGPVGATELLSMQVQMPTAGTFKFGNAGANNNTRVTNASVWSERINGLTGGNDGTIAVSIPADGSTGQVVDKVHSDATVLNDLLDVVLRNGSGTGQAAGLFTFVFETIDFSTLLLASGNGNQTYTTGSTIFEGPNGRLGAIATELNIQTKSGIPCVTSRYGINVVTNAMTTASTLTYRKDAGVINGSISVPGSGTFVAGYYNDNVNTDAFTSINDMSWKMVCGTGGSMTVANMSCKVQAFSPHSLLSCMGAG